MLQSKTTRNVLRFCWIGIFPLVIGVAFYLVRWNQILTHWNFAPQLSWFQAFLLYQMSDALWAFAFSGIIGLIWYKDGSVISSLWKATSVFSGIFWELFQWSSGASRHFDFADAISTVTFGTLGLYVAKKCVGDNREKN